MNTRKNYKETMQDIVKVYSDGIKNIRQYREMAKPHKINFGETQEERELAPILDERANEEVNKRICKIKNKVDEILKEYENAEIEYFKLHGEDITPDEKLLSLPLTLEQVQELQTRYKDNQTMLSLINNKAKSMNYPIKAMQKAESRIEAMKNYNAMLYPRFKDCTGKEECKYPFEDVSAKITEQYDNPSYFFEVN